MTREKWKTIMFLWNEFIKAWDYAGEKNKRSTPKYVAREPPFEHTYVLTPRKSADADHMIQTKLTSFG